MAKSVSATGSLGQHARAGTGYRPVWAVLPALLLCAALGCGERVGGGASALPAVSAAPAGPSAISGRGRLEPRNGLLRVAGPALPAAGGYDENLLPIAHFDGSLWELLTGMVDVNANTITVITDSFSPFTPVAVPEPGTGVAVLAGLLGLAVSRRRLHS